MEEEKLKQLEIVFRTILGKYIGRNYTYILGEITKELLYEVKIRIPDK